MTDADNKNNKGNETKKTGTPGMLKIIQGILAGALGVQSDRHRQADFSSQNPLAYIVAGLLFTGIFVGGLILVVNLVLAGQ